jgi:hypothetical protein
MSRRIAVVHEARADFLLATELADRELVDAIEWLEVEQLDSQRTWLSELAIERPSTWMSLKALAKEAGIRSHGHFGGEAAQPDAAAARRAILFLLNAIPDLAAILLIRDQDDERDRRRGLEQARDQDQSGLHVVIGLAIVERECWVISGFDPLDEAEESRLTRERTQLGFDPRTHSHQLHAGKDNRALRSSKRVLRALAQGDRDREARCWRETSLATLRERGADNGLAAYLNEIRNRLAPLIGHVPHG